MDVPDPHRVDKGKGRAREEVPTENTPLLGSTSGSLASSREASVEHPTAARRRLYSRLVSVFLITLSFCVLFFVLLALIAYSLRSRASDTRPEELISRALTVRGPDKVEVLNATAEDGVWLMVHGRMGFDAGAVIGVKSDLDDTVGADWWKSVGRWGIRQLDRVTVTLSTVVVASREHPNVTLATVEMPPLEVPLTADPPPHDVSWLTPVEIPVRIQPTHDVDALLHFLKDSWRNGFMSVQALVGHATVRGGGLNGGGWRSLLAVEHSNVRPIIWVKGEHFNLTRPDSFSPFHILWWSLVIVWFAGALCVVGGHLFRGARSVVAVVARASHTEEALGHTFGELPYSPLP